MSEYELERYDEKSFKIREKALLEKSISILDEWGIFINDILYSDPYNELVENDTLLVKSEDYINQVEAIRKVLINELNSLKNTGD